MKTAPKNPNYWAESIANMDFGQVQSTLKSITADLENETVVSHEGIPLNTISHRLLNRAIEILGNTLDLSQRR